MFLGKDKGKDLKVRHTEHRWGMGLIPGPGRFPEEDMTAHFNIPAW